MLKIWDEKHKRDKIAAIIAEMRKYKGIKLTVGRFGQDNRDWLVDKEAGTISQSISSVSYMSKQVAKDLYRIGQEKYDSFTAVLRALQMDTCLNTRQIKILIELGYFETFGKSAKLMAVYEEFFNGKNKLTKEIKSYEARINACKHFEFSLPDKALPIGQRLDSELNNVGLCLSTEDCPGNVYFITNLDDKYGIKTEIYSISRGTSGIIRVRKNDYKKKPFNKGDCLKLIRYNKSPKYTYRNNGARMAFAGEMDIWAEEYEVISSRK